MTRVFRIGALALAVGAGCSGSIGADDPPSPTPAGSERPGGPPAAPGTAGPSGASPGGASAAPPAGGPGVTPSPAVPPPPSLGSDRPAEPPPSLPTLGCAEGPAGAGPARLWRLSSRQWLNTVAVFLSGRRATGRPPGPPSWLGSPFEAADSAERFSNYASAFTMSDFEMRRAVNTTGEVAAALVAQLRKDPKSCLSMAAPKPFEPCVRALVEERGPLLFSRPLAGDELDRYTALAVKALPTVGEDEAAALAFQQLLLSPSFLYRRELGSGAADSAGRVRLDEYELAAALAFTLTDAPPDTALWAAARAGTLSSSGTLRTEAARLIGTFSSSSSTTLRFLREYFKYDGVLQVFKDVRDYKPADMVSDTNALVAELLTAAGQKDLLATLLTTNLAYYSHWTAKHFSITTKSPYQSTRLELPPQERGGLLTNPAFLMAFSDTEHNLPVQRGRFVSESLLCREVPELPIGLVPVIPEDPQRTLREKLAIHSKDPTCAACHHLMDPLGLAFETYDHLGRFRTTDAGKPVDASGELRGAGAADGPFTDAVSLTKRLARAPLVEECFLRHSFRYWMGRNEQAHDACTLKRTVDAYRQSGGDYKEALLALFTSDSFLYRSTK